MSQLKDFDINQLMLMLHGELRMAFEAAQSSELISKLRIDSVSMKMGQRNVSPTGEEPANACLLDSERYPDEEDWEVNLTYKYGDPIPDLPGSLMWVSSRTSGLVLERLKDIPVKAVKGVDRAWETILKNAGISNIEQLANYPANKVRDLCREHRSLQPLEFQTQVLLLAREFNPLDYPEFYHITLMEFLLQSNEELKKRFLGKLSEPELSSLKAMAAIICTVIDRRTYKNLEIRILAPPE